MRAETGCTIVVSVMISLVISVSLMASVSLSMDFRSKGNKETKPIILIPENVSWAPIRASSEAHYLTIEFREYCVLSGHSIPCKLKITNIDYVRHDFEITLFTNWVYAAVNGISIPSAEENEISVFSISLEPTMNATKTIYISLYTPKNVYAAVLSLIFRLYVDGRLSETHEMTATVRTDEPDILVDIYSHSDTLWKLNIGYDPPGVDVIANISNPREDIMAFQLRIKDYLRVLSIITDYDVKVMDTEKYRVYIIPSTPIKLEPHATISLKVYLKAAKIPTMLYLLKSYAEFELIINGESYDSISLTYYAKHPSIKFARTENVHVVRKEPNILVISWTIDVETDEKLLGGVFVSGLSDVLEVEGVGSFCKEIEIPLEAAEIALDLLAMFIPEIEPIAKILSFISCICKIPEMGPQPIDIIIAILIFTILIILAFAGIAAREK